MNVRPGTRHGVPGRRSSGGSLWWDTRREHDHRPGSRGAARAARRRDGAGARGGGPLDRGLLPGRGADRAHRRRGRARPDDPVAGGQRLHPQRPGLLALRRQRAGPLRLPLGHLAGRLAGRQARRGDRHHLRRRRGPGLVAALGAHLRGGEPGRPAALRLRALHRVRHRPVRDRRHLALAAHVLVLPGGLDGRRLLLHHPALPVGGGGRGDAPGGGRPSGLPRRGRWRWSGAWSSGPPSGGWPASCWRSGPPS